MSSNDSTGWPRGAPPSPALCGEDARAEIVASYGVAALHDDDELTDLAAFAARLCDCPVSLVSIVEPDRQVFIARSGTDLSETPRSVSFCAHTMLSGEPIIVCDAAEDPRFADNALVTGEPHIRFYAGAPLLSDEGAPLGALCVIDFAPRPGGLGETEREGLAVLARAVMARLRAVRIETTATHTLAKRDERLRALADWLPDIIWSADAEARFDYFNERWRKVTGVRPPRTLAEWGPHVHPDDVDPVLKAWDKAFAKRKPFQSEYRLRMADGEWRWTLARALPVEEPDRGVATRWYGTLTDIDDSRRQSDGRDLLARELSHRIKNIFAVVAGLISIRARRHPEWKDLTDELIGAIRALGRAHDFVRPIEGEKGDSLRALLGELMAPYADGDDRVRIEGGDCKIGARAGTPLALVFHELATNSAKYGALSVDEGKVEITIDCADEEAPARIHWRENGGPAVTDEGYEGFGSRLMTMAIEGQLGGTLERRFTPDGLEVDLTMQLKAIHS